MNISLADIEALLDKEVRPSLHQHGGDVKIYSFEDDILRVTLTGKCSGCPSAHTTNEEIIAASVQEAFPQIKQVLLVDTVSQELMDFARKLLNHESVD